MKKRQKIDREAVIQKKIEDGYGQGRFKDYRPWIDQFSLSSKGRTVNLQNFLAKKFCRLTHLGIILEVNNLNYYVPLASPKKKHERMRNKPDFVKIEDENRKLLAVLNLNNMIPVPDNCLTQITLRNIGDLREFKNNHEKENYTQLLYKEMKIIETLNENNNLNTLARKLYNRKLKNPTDWISRRCCEFLLLEEKCKLYETL